MKRKATGTPFKKGQAPKSEGRPTMTEEEKKLSKLTRTQFKSILREFLQYTKDDLDHVMKYEQTTCLELMVGSSLRAAIKLGDERKLNWFMEQLFGKLKENVELSGGLDNKLDLTKLSTEQLLILKDMVKKCST